MTPAPSRYLYGAKDGTWLVLEIGPGLVVPHDFLVTRRPGNRLVAVDRIGSPRLVIVHVLASLARRGLPAQTALAALLDTHQANVSRWASGQREPHLTDTQYVTLVRLYFDPAPLLEGLRGPHAAPA